MSSPHPHPWHRGSLFGDGPRHALNREQRARFRFLLNAHRRAGRITPKGELVGQSLVRRLSVEGRCDPGHETIAADVGCHERTVRRALGAMKALGLVIWQRRIVRAGWRTEQTSNAYLLVPSGARTLPTVPAPACGGHFGRQTRKDGFCPEQQPILEVSEGDRIKAQAALDARRRVMEARLLGRRSA